MATLPINQLRRTPPTESVRTDYVVNVHRCKSIPKLMGTFVEIEYSMVSKIQNTETRACNLGNVAFVTDKSPKNRRFTPLHIQNAPFEGSYE